MSTEHMTCMECGGHVAPESRAGRMRSYRGETNFEIPAWLEVPTCHGKLLLSEHEMKLDPNHLGTVAARVQGLPIQGPGQYRIGVEWHDPHALAWKEGPWAGLWIPPLEQPAPANPETNG